jgi:PhoH-like ATPase
LLVNLKPEIKTQNALQKFALHLLFDTKISLLTLSGKAGTGKKLLALQAGLSQVIGSNSRYRKVIMSQITIASTSESLARHLEQIPLAYIKRCRLHKQFVIINEVQNLTLSEVRTIITRLGEGTKMILIGDIDRIDNPALNLETNGFTAIVEELKEEERAAHLCFNNDMLSESVEVAKDLLQKRQKS